MLGQQRAYLEGMAKHLTSLSSTPVTSALLEGRCVAETLNGHAAAMGADLIVMTTHGRGPLSRSWLGSVADELVRRATKPILLVRPQEKARDLSVEPVLRHILVPLDGSALAEKVLESAVALGSLFEAHYLLAHIYEPLLDTSLDSVNDAAAADSEPTIEELRARAQDYLNRVAERLQQEGKTVQTQVVLGQHPASGILDTAQRSAVDLIALETHGRRGLSRLLLGSVADKVIRGASLSVLIHRL